MKMDEEDNFDGEDFHPVTELNLRPVCDISYKYRSIFSAFPYFNVIQSKVFDLLLYTDDPLVVSAPTGSGKTVLFELAIVRLLELIDTSDEFNDYKVVYMAPVKALCSEKYQDWERKFGPLGVNCLEVTGDSDLLTLQNIKNYHLILTTPEKWDSMTRKWKDHMSVIQLVKLFLIDEVHLLNEDKRGPTLEAVVSRMKTVQNSIMTSRTKTASPLRFIAVSATIPNIVDVAQWLGIHGRPAHHEMIGEEMRPVKLNKIVMGFPYNESKSAYFFDMTLSYQIPKIIFRYSEGKPTLVFCSTRKGVQYTSSVLVKQVRCKFTEEEKYHLEEAAASISDGKLRENILAGVGNHHAGMSVSDRMVVEELFREGKLPILVTTSTLAMGVNLPAHLVIIKSTDQFIQNTVRPYSEAQLMQMIGRAGRPQFDTSATAVIMTKDSCRMKYEKLVAGEEVIESYLHRHLAEHLNAEIVLRTVTDVAVAVDWIRSTFLYVRAFHNPAHYGFQRGLSKEAFESKLQDMCLRELNGLARFNVIQMNEGYDVVATEEGQLMARYYLAFDTMKLFMKIKGTEKLQDLLEIICKSSEFSEVRLRVNEKQVLNALNSRKDDEVIRYPLQGRIKTKEQKINCLIQAYLGHLPIYDPSLKQEAIHIMRNAMRICKGLAGYAWHKPHYKSLVSALYLAQSFQCNMWENSPFVARQLYGIGPALSSLLVMAGKTTFKSIAESNPRDLEKILNRHPPFGNNLQDSVLQLPNYRLSLSMSMNFNRRQLHVLLELVNYEYVEENGNRNHRIVVLVGGSDNKILHKEKLMNYNLIMKQGAYNFIVTLDNYQNPNEVEARVISEEYVGIDVAATINGNVELKAQSQIVPNIHQTAIDVYMKKKKKLTPIKKQTNQKVLPKLQNKMSAGNRTSGNTKLSSNVDIKKYLHTSANEKKLCKYDGAGGDCDDRVSSTCDFIDLTASSSEQTDLDFTMENKQSIYFQNARENSATERRVIDQQLYGIETLPSTSSGFCSTEGLHFMTGNNFKRTNFSDSDYGEVMDEENTANYSNSHQHDSCYLNRNEEITTNEPYFYSSKLPWSNNGIVNQKISDKGNLKNIYRSMSPVNQNSIPFCQSSITDYYNNSSPNTIPTLDERARNELRSVLQISETNTNDVPVDGNIIPRLYDEFKENCSSKNVHNKPTQHKKPAETYEKQIFDSICQEYKDGNSNKRVVKRGNPIIKQKKSEAKDESDKSKLTTKTIPDYLANLFQKKKHYQQYSSDATYDLKSDTRNHNNENILPSRFLPPKEYTSNYNQHSSIDNVNSQVHEPVSANCYSGDKVIQTSYTCKEILTPSTNNYIHPSLNLFDTEKPSSPFIEELTSPVSPPPNNLEEYSSKFSQLTPFLVLPEDVIDNQNNKEKKNTTLTDNKSENNNKTTCNEKFFPLFIKNGKIYSKREEIMKEQQADNDADNVLKDVDNQRREEISSKENVSEVKPADESKNDYNSGNKMNSDAQILSPEQNEGFEEVIENNFGSKSSKQKEQDIKGKANELESKNEEESSTDLRVSGSDILTNTIDIFEEYDTNEEENVDDNTWPINELLEKSVWEDNSVLFQQNLVKFSTFDYINDLQKELILQNSNDYLNETCTDDLEDTLAEKEISSPKNDSISKVMVSTPTKLDIDIDGNNDGTTNSNCNKLKENKVNKTGFNSDSGSSENDFCDIDYVIANKIVTEPITNESNRDNHKPSFFAVEKLDLTSADVHLNLDSDEDNNEIELNYSKTYLSNDNPSLTRKSKSCENLNVTKQKVIAQQNTYSDLKSRNIKRNEAYLLSLIDSQKLNADRTDTTDKKQNLRANDSLEQHYCNANQTSVSNSNSSKSTECVPTNLKDKGRYFSNVTINVTQNQSDKIGNFPSSNDANFEKDKTSTVQSSFNDDYRKRLGLPSLNSTARNENHSSFQVDKEETVAKSKDALNDIKNTENFSENSLQFGSVNLVHASLPSPGVNDNVKRSKVITDFYPAVPKRINEPNFGKSYPNNRVTTNNPSQIYNEKLNNTSQCFERSRTIAGSQNGTLEPPSIIMSQNLEYLKQDKHVDSTHYNLQCNRIKHVVKKPYEISNNSSKCQAQSCYRNVNYGNITQIKYDLPSDPSNNNVMEHLKKFLRKLPSKKLVHDSSMDVSHNTTSLKENTRDSVNQNQRIINDTSDDFIDVNELNINDDYSSETYCNQSGVRDHENQSEYRSIDRNVKETITSPNVNNSANFHQCNCHNCLMLSEGYNLSECDNDDQISQGNLAKCYNNSATRSCHIHTSELAQTNQSNFGIIPCMKRHSNPHSNCCSSKQIQLSDDISTQINYKNCNCRNCLNNSVIQNMHSRSDFHSTKQSLNDCTCGTVSCEQFSPYNLVSDLSSIHENLCCRKQQIRHHNSFSHSNICCTNHQASPNVSRTLGTHSKYFTTPVQQCINSHKCNSDLDRVAGNHQCENSHCQSHHYNVNETYSKHTPVKKRKMCTVSCDEKIHSQLSSNLSHSCNTSKQANCYPLSDITNRFELSQNQCTNTTLTSHTYDESRKQFSELDEDIFSPLENQVANIKNQENEGTDYLSAINMLKLSNTSSVAEENNLGYTHDMNYNCDNKMNYSQRDIFDY